MKSDVIGDKKPNRWYDPNLASKVAAEEERNKKPLTHKSTKEMPEGLYIATDLVEAGTVIHMDPAAPRDARGTGLIAKKVAALTILNQTLYAGVENKVIVIARYQTPCESSQDEIMSLEGTVRALAGWKDTLYCGTDKGLFTIDLKLRTAVEIPGAGRTSALAYSQRDLYFAREGSISIFDGTGQFIERAQRPDAIKALTVWTGIIIDGGAYGVGNSTFNDLYSPTPVSALASFKEVLYAASENKLIEIRPTSRSIYEFPNPITAMCSYEAPK